MLDNRQIHLLHKENKDKVRLFDIKASSIAITLLLLCCFGAWSLFNDLPFLIYISWLVSSFGILWLNNSAINHYKRMLKLEEEMRRLEDVLNTQTQRQD